MINQVLQANGQDPELFEIPVDLINEVQFVHPKLNFYLKLKQKYDLKLLLNY